MGNIISILITTLLSGLVATIATFWWQSYSEKKRDRIKIFTILMSKRYDMTSEESVEALNMIDVVFYKNNKIRYAWKEFYDAVCAPQMETKPNIIEDKYLKLLEYIARSIGYKNIYWDNIKQYYYPKGLASRKDDENVLRRIQIDAGIAQINDLQKKGNLIMQSIEGEPQ